MPNYGFGAGALWGTPLTDASGNLIANPTPVLFGVLQDVSVEISGDIKELFGQNQFAEAVARGKCKISCKAKFGRVNGLLINSLFFGQTLLTGSVANYYDTTGSSIPAAGPYFLNPTPPASGTWVRDLGVRDSTGNFMTNVATAPATGQYAVAGPVSGAAQASFATNVMTVTVVGTGAFAVGQAIASAGVAAGTTILSLGTGTGGLGTYNLSTAPGTIAAQAVSASEVYQFAAADAGKTVFVSFNYSASSLIAKNSIVSNIAMGNAPAFRCDLLDGYAGSQTSLSLYKCISTKLMFATKQDDFMIPELDFSAFADSNARVLQWGTSE